MYNGLYKFLETNNLIYSLQFGFRQKHSTSHVLIHLTDKIREQLDKGNFACGIFVDFRKAFDIADHEILIQKLNHYGIRGIANNWFSSYFKIELNLLVSTALILMLMLFAVVSPRVLYWDHYFF